MVSRVDTSSARRPVAVWVIVTAAATSAVVTAPGAWRTARPGSSSEGVADLLVAVCATVLALALVWLWVVTTTTVAGLVTGRHRLGGSATRRLVLVACGVAVVAGTSVPALATGGDDPELLVGLTLPERAVAPARHATPHQQHRHESPTELGPRPRPDAYVVRPGDSLWSIARSFPVPSTSVDRRWRAIWNANRDVVGDDPDLIIPGQALRLPPTPTTQDPTTDGDR